MLVNGNHTPERCAQNAMNTTAGEAYLNMEKGLDGELVDGCSMENAHLLLTNARKVVKEFEPRLKVDRVVLEIEKDRMRVNVKTHKWKEGED